MKADEIFRSVFPRRFSLTLIFCIFILAVQSSSAQVSNPDYLIKIKPRLTDVYIPDSMGRNKVVLYTDFNSEQILNPKRSQIYADKAVVKIELIYSTYRLASTFNQPELNRKRLESLKKLSPDLF